MKRPLSLSLAVLILCASAALAADPAITSITPSTLYRTWIGTIEVNGSEFQNGATLFFGDGLTDAVSGSQTISTTFVSSTEISGYIRVSHGAILGAVALEVHNPDGGVGTQAAVATVVTAPAQPSVTSVTFDTVPYTASHTSSNPLVLSSNRPQIRGTIADASGLSLATIDFKVLVDNVVQYDNPTNANIEIDPGGATATFTFTPPVGTPLKPNGYSGSLKVYINVKDVGGDPGEFQCEYLYISPEAAAETGAVNSAVPVTTIGDFTAANPAAVQVDCKDETVLGVAVVGSNYVTAQGTFTVPGGRSYIAWDGDRNLASGATVAQARAALIQASAAANGSGSAPVMRPGYSTKLFLFRNITTGRMEKKVKVVKANLPTTP
jgi:hypothetical protein